MKTLALLLADGFEEVEAVTVLDFLRRADIKILAAGIARREVTGAHGIALGTDCLLADLPSGLQGIVLPGGMPGAEHLAASTAVLSLVGKVYASGGLVAAICAAPGVVLGRTTVLDGRRFTCFPGFENRVKNGRHVEAPVVVDGDVITSRAPGTAGEFAFAIIDYIKGAGASAGLKKGSFYH